MTPEELDRQRTLRYSSLIPLDRFQSTPIIIVGLGAIGRQVALLLASMGARTIHGFDGDTVEPLNLGPQLYREDQVGRPKAAATADDCTLANPLCSFEDYPHWDPKAIPSLTRSLEIPTVFACVDKMDVRKQLFESHPSNPFFDGRMGANTLHIFSATDPASRAHYLSKWFPDSESEPLGCTDRATAYTAYIAAGLLVSQYIVHLRGEPVEKHFTFNIPGLDLFTRN